MVCVTVRFAASLRTLTIATLLVAIQHRIEGRDRIVLLATSRRTATSPSSLFAMIADRHFVLNLLDELRQLRGRFGGRWCTSGHRIRRAGRRPMVRRHCRR
uniref:Putative secreted protein n=1 Tax=Anopheles darlingi TaxID=43151 RepID=A0A2M4D6E6_ANODA